MIGACVTHADIEDGRVPDVPRGAAARGRRGIAYRAVRNRGTIGGSLVHADPAADWVSAWRRSAPSHRARRRAATAACRSRRSCWGCSRAVLSRGELLTAIHVPASPRGALGLPQGVSKTGEFAHAIGAFVRDPGAPCAARSSAPRTPSRSF